ncbi:hypothetical protein MRX96_001637 [Rhipicephalus microplus]
MKKLAVTCSFGMFLEEVLRDRLFAGLRSDTIWCHLLALPDDEVTWDWVCEVATAIEAAQGAPKTCCPTTLETATLNSTGKETKGSLLQQARYT